jgi:pyruvate dehydrogenase E2 component (dihydrolipoamide acetyltransferase)
MSEYSDNGIITKWRVKVGDIVQKGEALADVDVDMSITEIIAEATGKIDEIWVRVDQSVPVETIIAMQSVDETAIDEESAIEETQQEAAVEDTPEENTEDEFDIFPELGDETTPYVDPESATAATGTGGQYGHILASPDAIQLAEQHNVNIEPLIGTGLCGRIERADVEMSMQSNSRFITAEDVDDLMSFEGDFASKLPSDEPTSTPEVENEHETALADQTEAAQTETTEEEPTEASDTEVEAPSEEAALPTEVAAEAPDDTVPTPDVIYMSAGPQAADAPAALAIDESDTIDSDEKPDSGVAVKEEQNAETEPAKLSETTIEQIIEQSVTDPCGKSVRLRRLVARKMQQSWQQAPHFFVTVAVDMTDVIRFRSDLGVTINDFILAATTRSLQEHPWVNSHFIDDEAVEQAAINISLAVETEQGLYYPVIKDCAGKSVREIGISSAEMVVKAHSGRLAEEEMTDGSFTITNMGMLGVESFSAIITPPQVAVLAVGTVRGEVIIDDHEEMAMAPMVRLTLSGDHRALDGADAADFLGTMKSYLEAPITLVESQEDN